MLYQLVTYNHKVPRTFEEIEDIIQNGTVEDIENNWDAVDTYRNEADAYSAAEEFDPTVDVPLIFNGSDYYFQMKETFTFRRKNDIIEIY